MSSTLRWFKSSYTNAGGGECIEVAFDRHRSSHTVHIRGSKKTGGPLAVAPSAWSAFPALTTAE
ncbi:DUF397 domain-containing protein [Streptomyces coeruleoprunus]|uniref:DUF397 domain-containing protein n=1 Tax=Streptomyces coeruleoprunus TaxID=285563 RepID=A0ABV9XC14_9ACTN